MAANKCVNVLCSISMVIRQTNTKLGGTRQTIIKYDFASYQIKEGFD